jgi:hypothetical protein
MPAAKRGERTPRVGDRVRVYVDATMIDESATIIRVDRDRVAVHVWPDLDARVAMHARWFADEKGATAHGAGGAWPDGGE